MENMFLDDEELVNAITLADTGEDCGNCPETPVMIQEPESTEAVPAVEPNPVDIPVVPDIAPPMQDIPVQAEPVTNPTETPTCCPSCDMENLTVSQYFGTMIESIQITWKFHLKSHKHSEHVILNEYYDDAQDLIDTIIENYQGRYGIVSNYSNCICDCEKTPVTYLTELRDFILNGRDKITEISTASELMSDIDALVSKIDSTLYKLNNLVENNIFKTFDEFVKENKQ